MAESTGTASGAGSRAGTLAPLVQLPDRRGLSEPQMRGQACVWCAVSLGCGTSVDLGERADADRRWFPRGCRPCAIRHVYPAQLDHTQTCEQCTDDPGLCAPGTWLRLVMRQVRR